MAGELGENLQAGTIARNSLGHVLACGWYDDAVRFHAASEASLARQPLTAADATELVVCAAVVGAEEDPPRSCVIPQADGSVLVAVDVGGTLTVYQCRHYDDGFEVVA